MSWAELLLRACRGACGVLIMHALGSRENMGGDPRRTPHRRLGHWHSSGPRLDRLAQAQRTCSFEQRSACHHTVESTVWQHSGGAQFVSGVVGAPL